MRPSAHSPPAGRRLAERRIQDARGFETRAGLCVCVCVCVTAKQYLAVVAARAGMREGSTGAAARVGGQRQWARRKDTCWLTWRFGGLAASARALRRDLPLPGLL